MSTEDRIAVAVEKLVEQNAEIIGALAQVHTLVNSNLTAQMNDTLRATLRDLSSLKEIVALKEEKGLLPTPEALHLIQAVESEAGELRAKLRDRAEATEIGAEQAEKD